MRLAQALAAVVVLVTASVTSTPGMAAAAEPSSLVEDFAYPGAAQILAEHGVKVVTGDGRIRFAPDCAASADLFEVWHLTEAGVGRKTCFSLSGPRGFLTLEIPRAYLVWGGAHRIVVTSTAEGRTTTTTVAPGAAEPLGTGGAVNTVLELRANGEPGTAPGEPGPFPFAVRVETAGRACAGALVAREWVATATSCFGGGTIGEGPPPRPSTVVVGRSDLDRLGGHERAVVKLVPRSDRDLTLAKLDRPVTEVVPVPLARLPLTTGQPIRGLGYGRSASDWTGRRLVDRALGVGAVAATTVNLNGDPLCKGDAGAPLLRAGELVGVAVASSQAGCVGEAGGEPAAVAARIDDLAGWVVRTVTTPSRLGAFYNYIGSSTGLWMFDDVTGTGGSRLAWSSGGANSWDWTRTKAVSGDFDADGRNEIVAFYDYGGGRTTVFFFDGVEGVTTPVKVWESPAGTWEWPRMNPVSGDFDGDGRDEIAVFYDYGSGNTAVWLFVGLDRTASARMVWNSGLGTWEWNRIKPVASDFDGDGRDEIAAFYDYSSGSTGLWIFDEVANAVTTRNPWRTASGMWEWGRTYPVAADFDGDGRAEIAAFYDYGNTSLAVWLFDDVGGTPAARMTWSANGWEAGRMKLAAGDFDADGRGDIAVLYNEGSSRTTLRAFTNVDGAVSVRTTWDSGIGTWEWARTLATA
ncbi:peptidase S1 and S6 chymotrypsin/Hap [Actinosynnema mirum DSM 43827]|uniref:Peptidase S1 and S6 chymotrypsin/Hap n=1 Tax=Actinosynnema mirum (strain ATCC 29888 / DSM 43827 / JCM 3225 / NBRC 14064 / NCIMB 13271 / NRRL B-12336 / IMRU 3971 / 101) TaxID=446462 RepID=C6WLJ6_ACTMD|nr:peptidase S1 and S6 chymotrypsin/Hap [Actinosynnema mirum DSM 43827]